MEQIDFEDTHILKSNRNKNKRYLYCICCRYSPVRFILSLLALITIGAGIAAILVVFIVIPKTTTTTPPTTKTITATTATTTTTIPTPRFLNTNSMNYPRYYHMASVLSNGKVLVTGGSNRDGCLNSVELYYPSAGVWTITGSMNYARCYYSASILTNAL